MNTLLIDESPIVFQPSLAKKFGVLEAIVMQQLHYETSRARERGVDDCPWAALDKGVVYVKMSANKMRDLRLTWLTPDYVRKILKRMVEEGLLLSWKDPQKPFDQTKWYAVNLVRFDPAQESDSEPAQESDSEPAQESDCYIEDSKKEKETNPAEPVGEKELSAKVFDVLEKQWLTVNPSQLDSHTALAEKYGFENWLRGWTGTGPRKRSNPSYVEKLCVPDDKPEPTVTVIDTANLQ